MAGPRTLVALTACVAALLLAAEPCDAARPARGVLQAAAPIGGAASSGAAPPTPADHKVKWVSLGQYGINEWEDKPEAKSDAPADAPAPAKEDAPAAPPPAGNGARG